MSYSKSVKRCVYMYTCVSVLEDRLFKLFLCCVSQNLVLLHYISLLAGFEVSIKQPGNSKLDLVVCIQKVNFDEILISILNNK